MGVRIALGAAQLCTIDLTPPGNRSAFYARETARFTGRVGIQEAEEWVVDDAAYMGG